MASSLSLSTTLVLFSVLLLDTLPFHASASSRGGFSVELIHRDSPKSPYYNPSSTHYDRILDASRRSMSRADYLFRASSKSDPGFQSRVISRDVEYLMTLTLGTPAIKRLIMADTGSDTIWTQCKPCKSCYKQKAPLFDPSKSSTYKKVGCQSPACQNVRFRHTNCNRSDSSCNFSVRYGDGSHTSGTLSTETFGFDSTAGHGKVSIPKLVFGCSTDSAVSYPGHSSGVVGLGAGPLSFITQLSSRIDGKFAYCFVPYSNTSASSVLSFGDKAIVSGKGAVTTPLVRLSSTFYYVTLEEITVSGSHGGGNIIVKCAGSSMEPGNVIVDSGTTFTLLDQEVVSSVEKQVSAVVKLPPAKPKDGLFRLCYDSSKIKSDSDLPDITFKFTGGAVKLSPINTFASPEEGITCLTILPSRMSIMGYIAQQNFHVGYDLYAQTLTFSPANCENF